MRFPLAAVAAVLLVRPVSVVLAEDPTTAAESSADKSRYTLLSPTPANLLREMQTDRPNATNSPQTIDAGHAQLEAGLLDYSYYHHHVGGTVVNENDFAIGQFNLRLGVLNNLELNAVVNAYETDRTHDGITGTDEAGSFGYTVLGGKLNFWGNDGPDPAWSSALAIQPQFKIPTATSDVGNGHFEFSVAFPFTITLPAGFHLAYQPGISYERNFTDSGDVTGFQNAVSIDHDAFSKLDVYVEYNSDVTTEHHVKAVQAIDVGGIYPLTDNLTVDAGVNFGLNDATTNLQFTTGMSVRF